MKKRYIETIKKYYYRDIEQMIVDEINNPGNHNQRLILCEKVECNFKPFHKYYVEMVSRKIKTPSKHFSAMKEFLI